MKEQYFISMNILGFFLLIEKVKDAQGFDEVVLRVHAINSAPATTKRF